MGAGDVFLRIQNLFYSVLLFLKQGLKQSIINFIHRDISPKIFLRVASCFSVKFRKCTSEAATQKSSNQFKTQLCNSKGSVVKFTSEWKRKCKPWKFIDVQDTMMSKYWKKNIELYWANQKIRFKIKKMWKKFRNLNFLSI